MSTPPLEEYVLTLEVERPNRGQVLAATRSGAPPAAVETVLQVPTFYCLVTSLLLFDIAALFEWKGQAGEGKHCGRSQRSALAALADSLGPDVTAEDLLSSDPRLPTAGRSLLAPSFFCAVVVGGKNSRGFGVDASGTKQRLLDAVHMLEMRVQCGLPPEPPQADSDAATPAPAPAAEAPAPVLMAAPRVSAAEAQRAKEQALQDEICAAVSQRFGQQVPKSAGGMLYSVMRLVLLGPQSVHAGPAEKHGAESSQSQEDSQSQSQSQGDSQQSGASADWCAFVTLFFEKKASVTLPCSMIELRG